MSEVLDAVFAYLYDDSDGRVVTLAYTVIQNEVIGMPHTSYTAYVGYAICMPGDQHCKARGRQISEGRMENLLSRMEIPLGDTTKRKERLAIIIAFLADVENTVDQYGGRLLSRTAAEHQVWEKYNVIFPPAPDPERTSTGIPELDKILDGGLPKASL